MGPARGVLGVGAPWVAVRVLAWRGGVGTALGLGPRRGPLHQASSGPVLPRWPEPRPCPGPSQRVRRARLVFRVK